MQEDKTPGLVMEQHSEDSQNYLTCHPTNQPPTNTSECHTTGIQRQVYNHIESNMCMQRLATFNQEAIKYHEQKIVEWFENGLSTQLFHCQN